MKPSVLFVCRHNTGRSQMAEAYLRHFMGDGVVAIMAEDGIDISSARPKLLATQNTDAADKIITMGCDVEGVPRIDDDWGLPDPKGQPPDVVRDIRDTVRAKAKALADELGRSAAVLPS
jgi:arsenate reductase